MSFNSYPSADCSLIEHWAQEAEGKRAGSRGERANFYSAPIPYPLPPTAYSPASSAHCLSVSPKDTTDSARCLGKCLYW